MLYSHPAKGTDKELLDSKSYIKLVENSELRGQVKIYYYSLQVTKEVFCVCVCFNKSWINSTKAH